MAPLALCIAYVVQRESLSRAAARARIVAKDSDRARFLHTAHGQNPQDAHLYDLVLNTAVLDLDSAVGYPTEPSNESASSRFSSIAYSIGSSLVKQSKKPLTIIVLASVSVNPRLCR